MLVNCVVYRRGEKLAELPVQDISDYIGQPDCFVWVALKDATPEELAEMQAATTPAARMAERIETGVPTPPELAGLSSADLAKFAAEAETAASA